MRLAMVVVIGAAIAGCTSKCDLAAVLAARAGDGAKDCGHASLGSDARFAVLAHVDSDRRQPCA